MTVWSIILIVCGVITLASLAICVVCLLEEKTAIWSSTSFFILIAALFVVPLFIGWLAFRMLGYLIEVWDAGGFWKHYKLEKKRKQDEEAKKIKDAADRIEYNRIKESFLKGELTRDELPRVENGITCFEFSPEMGLSVRYDYETREIVYVEREYNERLNRFFNEHKDLRLYRMYKFVYLPNLCVDLNNGDLFRYFCPNASPEKQESIVLDSTYPMQYLIYKEDATNISHGMFFFRNGRDNHGAEYIEGDFHPLHEGSDEEIIEQLDAIVKKVHDKHGHGGLYCTEKPPKLVEGLSDDYADEMFYWNTLDPEVAKLLDEVREKLDKLKEYGLASNLLLKLLKEKRNLSRLIINKDLRITLLDYNNMEIKMEPLVKAVYLLFLKHPEGIIFKHLPDYREELIGLYERFRPNGLDERSLQSIENVTNPLFNSINEKCARIRGAFISKFNDDLAESYYITGGRGEAKKITLPRDLVVWE